MIGLCLFLGSIISDFPEWEGEFDQYEEVFEEEFPPEEEIRVPTQIIASQENRESLIAYVQNHEIDVPYVSDPEIEALLTPLIPEGSTIVDYGMGLSPFLVQHGGMIHAFEREPQVFAKRYWQLRRKGVENVLLYCTILKEMDRTLDEYDFKEVSLICVSCGGREDLFLKGAERTINMQKPILLINLIGGLSFESGDRFVKEELERRIDEITKKGYKLKRIRGDLHLALPL